MQNWQSIGRRALMRGSLRYLALGGLALLAATLLSRRKQAGSGCTNQGLCARCTRVDTCRLPLGLSYKNDRSEPDHG